MAYDSTNGVLCVNGEGNTVDLFLSPNFTHIQQISIPKADIAYFEDGIALFLVNRKYLYQYKKTLDCLLWLPIFENIYPPPLSSNIMSVSISNNRDMIITDPNYKSIDYPGKYQIYPSGVAYYYSWNGINWNERELLFPDRATDNEYGIMSYMTDKFLYITSVDRIYVYEMQGINWIFQKYIYIDASTWNDGIPPYRQTPELYFFKIALRDKILLLRKGLEDEIQIEVLSVDCRRDFCNDPLFGIICQHPLLCKQTCDKMDIVTYSCECPSGYTQSSNGNETICKDYNERPCENQNGSYPCKQRIYL